MTKFSPLIEYKATQGQYQLLPFKFEPLDDHEVVITNFVGEFAFISREDLEATLSKKLDPNSKIYSLLRSRHFIKENGDEASIELLGLKTRTKYNKLRNFTNLHIFVVTLRCDHSCQYCQVSRQSENKVAFDMTIDMAEKALAIVFRSPNPAIKIEFQGGEPLLNFDLVKHIVLRAKEINETQKRDLQFVITSTLTLVTDEILVFCKSHKVYLSTSLDGPEDLHNRNRPRPGRDSYARFVEGLERTRGVLGFDAVSALMTTSPASLTRAKDIVDEYLKHGFDGIFFRHLSPYGFAIKTKSYGAYNVDRWLKFYQEGLDYIIELNKQGVRFTEHFAALMLTKMLTSNDPGYVDLMNPSGAGIAAVVFNYDGDIYASDESRMLREMDDTTFKIGNLFTSSYEDVFTNEVLLGALEDSFTLSAPMCSDCAFEPWCGADPVYHHAMHGDVLGRKPESEFCKRIMGVVKLLLERMKSDQQVKTIFMRWANRC
ncbi:His-Xaa-Ser system radical SAM maturase HxsB [Limnohabitans sp. 2KL-51]|uniref:His-Xaa-Ser system radical SAM maturase HxsB n=1 Tax=Limnohabitans sp. 2KL-51 TaxID=1977911 RepID=UPI000D33E794|nr:His-Xaa-Ser system radical SAM maturase HxsB [Limnohabitans sp. 2KL-51]PUE50125.1 His-Xaa-Ser system radical SAM maturase HxsB [Limnohabitans sp. 2KL-51]